VRDTLGSRAEIALVSAEELFLQSDATSDIECANALGPLNLWLEHESRSTPSD
jgi:hypothetical protein